MKKSIEIVRVGTSRLARGGTLVFGMVGAGFIAASGIRADGNEFNFSRLESSAQDTSYGRELLQRMRGVDPVVCQLAGRALDNRWGAWGKSIDGASLNDRDDAVFEWATSGEVGAEMMPVLRTSLGDSDRCVRYTAARMLGRLRNDNLHEELRTELSSTSAEMREAAVLALGHNDRIGSAATVQRFLRDESLTVKLAAIWALGRIESRESVAALETVAADREPRVRSSVAWALGQIESPSAVNVLTRMLDDADTTVRINAALALGQIESSEAIPALTRVLERDQDPRVRRAAAAALGNIGG